jgi:AmmeMemoRadiSam system protein A
MSPLPNSRKNEFSPRELSRREFSEEERRLLLDLAHRSIACALDGRTLSLELEPATDHLAEKRGAFCTLYLDGQLRGCVGYVFPLTPLLQTVAETARGAAFDDPRFPAVTPSDGPRLKVSLSILSVLAPIAPEQVEVGTHGLLVSRAGRRGVLLPQVPVEHGWERTTFLEQTCLKAGLPPDAWKTGATLESFTAEIFGDEGLA